MAARGNAIETATRQRWTSTFLVAAAVAAALSLTAALISLHDASPAPPRQTAAAELAARNQRIAFFEGRAARDPSDFVSLNVLAFEYLQRGRETGDLFDYDRAGQAASRSISLLPKDNFGATLALAAVRLTEHDFAAALALGEEAIALKPASAAAHGARGDALFGLGRYAEAGRAYQRMVDLEPDLAALARMAGLAYVEGDLLNAENFWRQAIERAEVLPVENLAWARVQLGRLYFSQGDLGRAAAQFERALAAYPDYAHAAAGLATVRAAEGRLDEAVAHYERVQASRPELSYVIALADAYAAAGRDEEMGRQYALVEVIDRLYAANGINTELAMARYYADHGRRLDRALTLAEAAYAAAPSVYAADTLAWALYKNGRLEQARRLIEEALRLGTPEASFHYHAGLIHRDLDNREAAIEHLTAALAINPHFSLIQAPIARDALSRLEADR